MQFTLKMPKLGDTAESVVIVQCYRSVGDSLVAGEPLFRVETDKVEVDVEAAMGGTLVAILVEEGAEISTGTPIAIVGEP
ncbi:biotin/lipoyl-containing protein [Gemmatimonas sp.]|uniref:biotin/lipoyl-containing protein n=1 Tax=Gemmatimonas sp. TaxID=1962908 RepID=UPI00356AF8C5